jgi:mRNA interferase HigB
VAQSRSERDLEEYSGSESDLSDFVEPYTVFNIRGGNYRLIVKIEYRWQMIFVKHVLTHAEYTKGGWKK